MSPIFMLFVILISSEGIFGLTRKIRATQGYSTQQITTDRNIVADYISQKLKGIEQATELSGNPNFSPGNSPNSPNLGPSITYDASQYAGQKQKDTGSNSPINQQVNDGTNNQLYSQQNYAMNQKNEKAEPVEKTAHNNLKTNSGDHLRMFESSSSSPDGYAMRISAETFEIDAVIDAANNTKSATRAGNITESERDNDNGSSESGEPDKTKLTSEGLTPEDDNSSGDVTTMNPVDEEIKHVLKALPNLPELGFSDNKSQFSFHKDPEEAALDDRITQVARQLAETSLRREFEEKKLGHYIPIRLRHYDDDYQSNVYTPARELTTDKSYSNAFEIFRQIQQPQVRFRALSVPQHIYNTPVFRSQDVSPQSPSKMHLSNSPGPVYVTETEGHTRVAVAPIFNSNGFGAIIQLGPRLALPVSKAALEQNRIPLIYGLTQPKSVQPFHNHNDLNTYPQRDIGRNNEPATVLWVDKV